MNNFNVQLPLSATLVVFLLLFSNSISANTKTDSLYHIVQAESNDSLKVVAYYALLEYVSLYSQKELPIYLEKRGQIFKDKKSEFGTAVYNRYKGNVFSSNRQYPEAVSFYEKAKDYFLKANHKIFAISVLKDLAEIERSASNLQEATDLINQAMKIATGTKDSISLGFCYYTLGNIAVNKGDNQKALEYYDSALISFKNKSVYHYLHTQFKQASILLQLDPSEALKVYEGIMIEAEKNNLSKLITAIYPDLAYAYRFTGDVKKSIEVQYRSIDFAEKTQDTLLIIQSKHSLAGSLASLGDLEKAKETLIEALIDAEKVDNRRFINGCKVMLGEVAVAQEKPEEAVEYYKDVMTNGGFDKDHIHYKWITTNLGIAYIDLGRKEEATVLFKNNLNSMPPPTGSLLYINGHGLGEIYVGNKKYKDAIKILKPIYEEMAKLGGDITIVNKISNLLYFAHKNLSNTKQALFFLEKGNEYQDSILNIENIQKATQTEMSYEFDKEKALLAQQKQADEAILKAETAQTRTAALGIGALALLALGFFYNARRNNKKITAQNDEISEKNNQLEQLNQTKDRIFAIIGHDLRKPVVAFNGISETINYLVKKEDYSTLQQLGAEIEKDGFALQKLTDNLLSWALTQREVMPYNPQAINLSEKAEEVILIFEKVARDKNIELTNNILKGTEVFADPNALLTILINLVDNALKYTSAGGHVSLDAVNEPEGIKILVKDTGIGISKEQMKDIFLLQKNKSQKGTGGEKGTGLGLHLVNELVKMNKGKIEAASNEGKGTAFQILLPARRLAAA